MAGSIGPLGKPLEPFGNIAFAEAVDVYREQAEGLAEGGVDLFAIETMPSLDQARAAVEAMRPVSDLPISVSLTFNEEGTTFYGDKPEDVVRTLEDWDVHRRGRQLQPGPAAHAGDRAAHGRGGRSGSSSPRCPTPAPRPWWTAATSTSARPSTWPPTRGASSPPE